MSVRHFITWHTVLFCLVIVWLPSLPAMKVAKNEVLCPAVIKTVAMTLYIDGSGGGGGGDGDG